MAHKHACVLHSSLARALLLFGNRPRSIFQYSNMAPRLSFATQFPRETWIEETTNIEVCSESLGAMLEY